MPPIPPIDGIETVPEHRRIVPVHPTVSELMPWMLDGIAEARGMPPRGARP